MTGELLEEIIHEFYPIITSKNITLEKNNTSNIMIESDKDRISQVFSNLIRNACDFVSQNNGKIEIGLIHKETEIE